MFEWLERAHATGDSYLGDLQMDVFFQRLHDDPRYKAILRKLKFPE